MKNKNPRQRPQLEAMAKRLGMELKKTLNPKTEKIKWKVGGEIFETLAGVEKFLIDNGGEKKIVIGRPKKGQKCP